MMTNGKAIYGLCAVMGLAFLGVPGVPTEPAGAIENYDRTNEQMGSDDPDATCRDKYAPCSDKSSFTMLQSYQMASKALASIENDLDSAEVGNATDLSGATELVEESRRAPLVEASKRAPFYIPSALNQACPTGFTTIEDQQECFNAYAELKTSQGWSCSSGCHISGTWAHVAQCGVHVSFSTTGKGGNYKVHFKTDHVDGTSPRERWVRICRPYVQYNQYNNFCVHADGTDAHQDGGHHESTLAACQSLCNSRAGCTGLEWYETGWGSKTCFLFQDAVAKGSSGSQWRDARCYVKACHQGDCPTGHCTVPANGRNTVNWGCCRECPGGTKQCYSNCACRCRAARDHYARYDACISGLMKKLPDAPKCLARCHSSCPAINNILTAYLTQGGQPAAWKAACKQPGDLYCMLDHLGPCQSLIKQAKGYGVTLPTSRSQLSTECGKYR